METWLLKTFKAAGPNQVIVYDGGTYQIVYDVTHASRDFGATAPVPTHAILSGLAIASQGWQRIFDSWKAQGLIN